MHHEPGRLIDHQQMFVLEHHVECHWLRPERLGLRRRVQLNLQQLSGAQPRRRFDACVTAASDPARGNQLLQIAAGETRKQLGQYTIKPFAVMLNLDRPLTLLDG